MHAITSLLYLFNEPFTPLGIYLYARKKHPFANNPAAKHPKHNKVVVTDIKDKPVNFF